MKISYDAEIDALYIRLEEKILTLQHRKREIIQATIGDDAEFAAALSWEEIQELLA